MVFYSSKPVPDLRDRRARNRSQNTELNLWRQFLDSVSVALECLKWYIASHGFPATAESEFFSAILGWWLENKSHATNDPIGHVGDRGGSTLAGEYMPPLIHLLPQI